MRMISSCYRSALRTDGDESEDSLKNIEEPIKDFVLAVRKLFEDCINVWIIQLKRIHTVIVI